MNNKYQDLAREAGLLVHNPERMPTKLQKFAELLIRECAEIADKGWAAPGIQIKQHFGVEP
jgi:hypothetical protein